MQDLTALAGRGTYANYIPLESPAEAVREASLIVKGTFIEVTDGVQVDYGDEAMNARDADSRVTFVVAVDKVLAGRSDLVSDGRVYVTVSKSAAATPQQLSRLNPQAAIVLVLADMTAWSPTPDAQVSRAASIPADAPLLAPYNDGMWLQGSADRTMHGIGVDRTELTPAWGGIRTVDQFSQAIERAAQND